MAFGTQELEQLNTLMTHQLTQHLENYRSLAFRDTSQLLDEKLRPLYQELEDIKKRLDQLFATEHEDVEMVYKEIDTLKKRMYKVEKKIAALESD